MLSVATADGFFCEPADPSEPLSVEYSPDGGVRWLALALFIQSHVTLAWQCTTIAFPPAAHSSNTTRIRFREESTSVANGDLWMLDQVVRKVYFGWCCQSHRVSLQLW